MPASRPALSPPGLDAWGRPLPGIGANRAALGRSTRLLDRWLNVLCWLLVGVGVLSASALVFGGLSLLRLTFSGGVPPAVGWLLALAGVLLLVLYGVYVSVVRWARELIVRLGRWALETAGQSAGQSPAPDAARIETLRRTLSGWLSFGQWGTVVGGVLSLALVPLSLVWSERFVQTLDQTLQISRTDALLNPALIALQTLSALVSAVPGIVITWLILGAIRHLMALSVGRARGLATAPIAPAASTVSGWFLACAILLGLWAILLVVDAALLTVFGAVFKTLLERQFAVGLPQDWQTLLNGGVAVLAVLFVLSLLMTTLLFCLLLWSRSYAVSLAAELDLASADRLPTPSP